MRFMSDCELRRRTEKELSAMFCQLAKGVAREKTGSPEGRTALALLNSINRARRDRRQRR